MRTRPPRRGISRDAIASPDVPEITTRDALLGDSTQIRDLLDELGYPDSVGNVHQRLEQLLASGDQRVFVAEAVGREPSLVGLASVSSLQGLSRPGPIARLSTMVVRDGWRGQGVGRLLVDRVVAQAVEWGCGALELTTAVERADAHLFYERLGFKWTSRRYWLAL